MITVLLDPAALEGGEARLEGDTYHHLFRVRRLAVGERLRLTDGRGRARWGEVAAVDRESGRVRLGDPAPSHEPTLRVELLVAALKRERASWLVEKATEIGVAAVRFLHTERTPRELGPGTFARLRRVAAAALEQCHRARLPEITGMHGWDELPSLLADLPDRRFLDPAGDPAGAGGEPAPVALLVGPEGGWTGGERDELLAAGCRPMTLGPRVLRVETAAVAGAALMLCPQPQPSQPSQRPR
jgi:16S rRNA (uracil1498-N3)-methyltransferase